MRMRSTYRGVRRQTPSIGKQAPGNRRRSSDIARAAAESLEVRRLLASIAVTTVADDITPGDGFVSLREAISAINAGTNLGDADIIAENPGTFGTGDTINFNIPGAGVQTIHVGSDASAAGIPLPTIVKPLLLNGYSQAGASPNTLVMGDNADILIQLEGSKAGATSDGLSVMTASGTTKIEGLDIVGFLGSSSSGGNGIHVLPGGGATANVTVTGNFIGVATDGITAAANANDGILVESPGNTIGGIHPADRNLISGNGTGSEIGSPSGSGIEITGAATSGNFVQGNYIGLDASGNNAVGNALLGVDIIDAGNNTIGGLEGGAGNVIGGNVGGIQTLENGGKNLGQNNIIQGNLIGTNADGTAAVPNSLVGLILNTASNLIGGKEAGAGNLISGNLLLGVVVQGGTDAGGNFIAGNFIGTDITGTLPLPNGGAGVLIAGPEKGNFIGAEPFAKAGAPNVIAFNGGTGIGIVGGSTGNQILFNSIHDNALLGIDLGDDGPNPIDPVQPDNGNNDLLNHPVITSVVSGPSGTTITGTISGSPNTILDIVQFFTNAAPDPSGFGEGQTVYATTLMGTDASGQGTFVYTNPTPIPVGEWLTATQTISETSEFSNAVQVTSPPDKPLSTIAVSPVSSVEGGTFSGQLVHFSDADSQALPSDFSATIDWGDSNTTTGTVTADSGGGFDVSGSHTYAEEGNDPIKITINDTTGRADAGGSNLVANTSASVSDAPLSASGKTISGHEGRLFSGAVATFTDINTAAPVGDFTASVNWGDGHTSGGVVSSLGGGQFSVAASHTYAEESNSAGYTMNVSIHDTGGSNFSATSVAKIADSPLDQAAGKSLQVGANTSFTNLTLGTFRDQDSLNSNPADYVGTIAWGDGSATSSAKFVFTGATFNVGSFWKVQGSHKYKVKKTYTVKITLHDIANPSVSLVITATIKVV